MSSSNLKSRHYAALASRLRHLGTNLSETEVQLAAMSERLIAMSRLGVHCGAQFMAVSRLLDEELRPDIEAQTRAQQMGQEVQSNTA